jgi:hypothetical protein
MPDAQPTPILNDAQHWRHRAEEARKLAQEISDPVVRGSMLAIAIEYDLIAERAMARALETSK